MEWRTVKVLLLVVLVLEPVVARDKVDQSWVHRLTDSNQLTCESLENNYDLRATALTTRLTPYLLRFDRTIKQALKPDDTEQTNHHRQCVVKLQERLGCTLTPRGECPTDHLFDTPDIAELVYIVMRLQSTPGWLVHDLTESDDKTVTDAADTAFAIRQQNVLQIMQEVLRDPNILTDLVSDRMHANTVALLAGVSPDDIEHVLESTFSGGVVSLEDLLHSLTNPAWNFIPRAQRKQLYMAAVLLSRMGFADLQTLVQDQLATSHGPDGTPFTLAQVQALMRVLMHGELTTQDLAALCTIGTDTVPPMDAIWELFGRLDINCDGKLSAKEFKMWLEGGHIPGITHVNTYCDYDSNIAYLTLHGLDTDHITTGDSHIEKILDDALHQAFVATLHTHQDDHHLKVAWVRQLLPPLHKQVATMVLVRQFNSDTEARKLVKLVQSSDSFRETLSNVLSAKCQSPGMCQITGVDARVGAVMREKNDPKIFTGSESPYDSYDEKHNGIWLPDGVHGPVTEKMAAAQELLEASSADRLRDALAGGESILKDKIHTVTQQARDLVAKQADKVSAVGQQFKLNKIADLADFIGKLVPSKFYERWRADKYVMWIKAVVFGAAIIFCVGILFIRTMLHPKEDDLDHDKNSTVVQVDLPIPGMSLTPPPDDGRGSSPTDSSTSEQSVELRPFLPNREMDDQKNLQTTTTTNALPMFQYGSSGIGLSVFWSALVWSTTLATLGIIVMRHWLWKHGGVRWFSIANIQAKYVPWYAREDVWSLIPVVVGFIPLLMYSSKYFHNRNPHKIATVYLELIAVVMFFENGIIGMQSGVKDQTGLRAKYLKHHRASPVDCEYLTQSEVLNVILSKFINSKMPKGVKCNFQDELDEFMLDPLNQDLANAWIEHLTVTSLCQNEITTRNRKSILAEIGFYQNVLVRLTLGFQEDYHDHAYTWRQDA